MSQSELPGTQVIVVGAGPVGLLLAGELRLAGADVVVLDRLPAPATESRASTLHSRTMEILDSRGLLDRLGGIPGEARGHFGGIPLDMILSGRHPGLWKVPQTRLEEALGAWAAELGAELRRGHEVTGLRTAADGVRLRVQVRPAGVPAGAGTTVTLRAAYVVGCDGEQSTVRRLGGFGFPGAPAGRELLRADVAGIGIPDRRFERTPRGLLIAARRPEGITRVMVHEFGARVRSGPARFEDVAAAWRRVAGEDISAGTAVWVNAFGDASRQADRYRIGRLLLAGDAAHQQLPIGGQALNLGLQDAFALGWRLAAVVRGKVPEEALDGYHTERHAVGQAAQSDIRSQALLLLGGPEVDGAREVMAELIGHERVRTHLAGRISGLAIRHRLDSPGAAATGVRRPAHRLLGRRLPYAEAVLAPGLDDAPGRERPGPAAAPARLTDTFALLRDGRALLWVPSADPARAALLRAVAEPWGDRVRVAVGELRLAPEDGPATALLVRPDGYVVWAGTGGTGATDSADGGLGAALAHWFGARPDEPARAGAAPRPAGPVTIPALPAPARRAHHTTATTTKRSEDTMGGRLTGRTALVTGASRGIGRAVAIRLAAQGALVAVHYGESKDRAAEVVEAIESDGGRAFAVRAVLGVPGDAEELFGSLRPAVEERTGTSALHILVNNAGVTGGKPVADTTAEDVDRLFAVNARAPFFLIRRALETMPDGGRIINISSGLTRTANPDETAYAMSKGALEQLALHYARLLGPRGITVNSVAPGITRNDNPLFAVPEAVEQMAALSAFGRVGEPEDVADVVAFLASDEARWVTGAFVDATGGTLLG